MKFGKMLALVVATACLASGACKKKETPAQQQQPVGGAPGEQGHPPMKRLPPMRRVMLPITVEEATPLLPNPDATRVVKPVAKVQVGERVEGAWCADTGEPVAIADNLKKKLEGVGWTMVTTRQHPALKDRIGVHARKEPFELTGFVQRGQAGQWAECVGDKGQTYVDLFVFKVEQRQVEPGAPGSPAMGPGGAMNPALRPGNLPHMPPGVRPIAPGQPVQPGQPAPAPAPAR